MDVPKDHAVITARESAGLLSTARGNGHEAFRACFLNNLHTFMYSTTSVPRVNFVHQARRRLLFGGRVQVPASRAQASVFNRRRGKPA